MPRAWIPSFVAFLMAAAGIYATADGDSPEFVVPNISDLTVKTRETIDAPQSTVRTNTLYFQERVAAERAVPGVSVGVAGPKNSVARHNHPV